MTRRQILLVIGVVLLSIAGLVFLLTTGGVETPPTVDDESGDVVLKEGGRAPEDTSLADIQFAEVRAAGEQIVFEARLGAPIPKKLKGQALDVGWDIYEGSTQTWSVSFNMDIGPNATVFSTTENYAAGTFDDTLRGGLEIEGDTIVIRFRPDKLPNFPESFQWRLKTSLDAAPGKARSARAEDVVPQEGFGQFSG